MLRNTNTSIRNISQIFPMGLDWLPATLIGPVILLYQFGNIIYSTKMHICIVIIQLMYHFYSRNPSILFLLLLFIVCLTDFQMILPKIFVFANCLYFLSTLMKILMFLFRYSCISFYLNILNLCLYLSRKYFVIFVEFFYLFELLFALIWRENQSFFE